MPNGSRPVAGSGTPGTACIGAMFGIGGILVKGIVGIGGIGIGAAAGAGAEGGSAGAGGTEAEVDLGTTIESAEGL